MSASVLVVGALLQLCEAFNGIQICRVKLSSQRKIRLTWPVSATVLHYALQNLSALAGLLVELSSELVHNLHHDRFTGVNYVVSGLPRYVCLLTSYRSGVFQLDDDVVSVILILNSVS